jgi:hypothetical protein
MGRTYHRKHYDKFNYDGDDFKKFKKRKKQFDRRNSRHRVLADKHSEMESMAKPQWEPDSEMTT